MRRGLTWGLGHSAGVVVLALLAILIKDTAGTDFFAGAGLDQAAYGDLTWTAFYLDNLLPVTLGNIVGGGVMIGVLYWTIFHYVEREKQEPERGGKGIASGAGS